MKKNYLILIVFIVLYQFGHSQPTCIRVSAGSFTLEGSGTFTDVNIKISAGGTQVINYIVNAGSITLPTSIGSTATPGPYTVTQSEISDNLGNDYSVGLCAALPVELISIKAENTGKANLITWQTASEKDNEGFHIERSAEGKTFETIGFVKGHGTSLEKQSYSFTDVYPLSISYYRLRQKDFDGKESYSKIVSVAFDSKEGFRIYPNPADEKVNIEFNAEKELDTKIELYDAMGRQVYDYKFQSRQGSNRLFFATQQFATGLYTLKIKYDNKETNEKVMIH
jgi:hypothetical protein